MEQNFKEKEGNEGEEFLSSINALQQNLSSVKSSLEKEFYKKEQKHKETIQATKNALDKVVTEYNKKILLKDKEVEGIKSSAKELIKKYEEIIKSKDEKLLSIKNKEDSEDFNDLKLENTNIPNELAILTKKNVILKLLEITKENLILIKKNDFLNLRSKELYHKFKNEYNKSLLDKDNEIEKLKSSVKELIKRYEEDISLKENKIKKFDYSSKIDISSNISELPKEVISLSKDELLIKLKDITKENLVLIKKLSFFNEKNLAKQEEYNTSKKAFERSFDSLSDNFLKLQEKNKSTESDLSIFKEKVSTLLVKQTNEKEDYEKKISKIISSYELKINGLIDKNTKEQMHMELSINVLKKEIESYKNKLEYKEEKKEEFIKSVEERIKSVVSNKASEFLKNYDTTRLNEKEAVKLSNSEDLTNQMKTALSIGDTKEKIIFDLVNKGYEKIEISNAYKNLKK